ncbi:MAG TPA: response regulator [Verrucomicrobiae bacterium]|nr:response regulator [Verrucomicrobiae bacterium]
MENHVVLLAEDDEDEVFLLERSMKKMRLRIDLQVVRDGEQALAYLRAEGKYRDRRQFPFPAFLLLDLCMPRMNGLEVLAAIREDPKLTRLTVVMLTVSEHQADICRASDLHANSYLLKPSDLTQLDEMVLTLEKYWLAWNHCGPCVMNLAPPQFQSVQPEQRERPWPQC